VAARQGPQPGRPRPGDRPQPAHHRPGEPIPEDKRAEPDLALFFSHELTCYMKRHSEAEPETLPYPAAKVSVRPKNRLRCFRIIKSARLMKQFWIYMMSNKSRRLYTSLAGDLTTRVIEHRLKLYPNSFTARYCFDVLV